ncbi:MAG TPA: methyltransferase domain-containing protein [Candidatus Paceibacterota bacterium]|nr:methyltransferase domain-containing protein [Candidatus Paceibacterota bacterium]
MKSYSIIRDGEYKNLAEVTLDGAVLDLGGNIGSEYHTLIKGTHNFTTVNIDPSHGCDLVFDIQEKFPLETGSFDAVLSMNVFEHIYGFHNAFSESSRVLKPGGTLVFAVPFMHHIHGCPDDYMRYTKSTLEKLLLENGFKRMDIREIGQGVCSLVYQSMSGALPVFLKPFLKGIAVSVDRFFWNIAPRYRAMAERIPLGYFVVAHK